jgi:hypothetical protein
MRRADVVEAGIAKLVGDTTDDLVVRRTRRIPRFGRASRDSPGRIVRGDGGFSVDIRSGF